MMGERVGPSPSIGEPIWGVDVLPLADDPTNHLSVDVRQAEVTALNAFAIRDAQRDVRPAI